MKQILLNWHHPIQAGVIFGNPKRNCAGHGICKVTSPESLSACSCFSATAFITFIPETGMAAFFFPKASCARALFAHYFKSDHFTVEEEVSFYLEDLGLAGGKIILQKGRYQLVQKDEGVSLFLSYRQVQQDHYSAEHEKAVFLAER
jgi:hypothetical protein